MWVSLEPWIVGDGEIPELRSGDMLCDVGLRAACRGIATSDAAAGVVELTERGAAGAPLYRLTGVVTWGRQPSSVLLDAGAFLVLAEPDTFRVSPQSRDAQGMEPYSPSFHVPDVGTHASIVGTLEVVPSYEWDAFEFPDARRDWRVTGIRLEQHSLVPLNGMANEVTRGAVVRAEVVDQLSRRTNPIGMSYLIDLKPTT